MIKYCVLLSAVFALSACGGKDASAPDAPQVPAAPVSDAAPKTPAPKAPAAPDAPQSISDLTLGEFSADLASRLGISQGDEMNAVKDQIRLFMAGEGDGTNAQAASFQTHYRTDGRTVFVATQAKLADDSVKARQVMAVFIPQTMAKSVVEGYGLRVKCQRGDNTEQWQITPCP